MYECVLFLNGVSLKRMFNDALLKQRFTSLDLFTTDQTQLDDQVDHKK